ncbi:MAG: hypothetical protein J6O53_00865 [Eubacterium sp.]|nr:hypothetical protein [Eubacterium sp.]
MENEKHEHITYDDCLRLLQFGETEITPEEEDWFISFDQRIDSCDRCNGIFERFKALNQLFPVDIAEAALPEEKERVSVAVVVSGMLERCEQKVKEKLSKWLEGTRSLLPNIPKDAFFAPSFAARGGVSEETVSVCSIEQDGVFALHVEKKATYAFVVRIEDDSTPIGLVIMDQNEETVFYELKDMQSGKYGNKSIVLEPGDYQVFVLTL